MRPRVRAIVLVTLAVSCTVFAIVQDRVTAAGARRYVTLQRQAITAGATPVRIDEVMKPAVSSSARQGLLWGGATLVAGLGIAAAAARLGEKD